MEKFKEFELDVECPKCGDELLKGDTEYRMGYCDSCNRYYKHRYQFKTGEKIITKMENL